MSRYLIGCLAGGGAVYAASGFYPQHMLMVVVVAIILGVGGIFARLIR